MTKQPHTEEFKIEAVKQITERGPGLVHRQGWAARRRSWSGVGSAGCMPERC